jgi:hypothetical protein
MLEIDAIDQKENSVASHSAGDINHVAMIQAAMTRSLLGSLIIEYEDLVSNWGDLEVTLQDSADFYFLEKQQKFSLVGTRRLSSRRCGDEFGSQRADSRSTD